MSDEEKKMYRAIAQKNGITITADTGKDMTEEEARKACILEILKDKVDFEPFIVFPLTTKERWENRCINFCPRCGTNIAEYELGSHAQVECYECDTYMDILIHADEVTSDWLETKYYMKD